MASNKNGVIRMFNGRMVNVFDLRPEDVVPINFIHALSLINRFTGASPWPVSVMQHSVMLTKYVQSHQSDCKYESFMSAMEQQAIYKKWYIDEQYKAKAAFLHDWSEALFNDLASPVKKNFAGYKQHEERSQKIIFKAMGVPIEFLHAIDPSDKQIYRDEVRATWGIQNDAFDTDRKGLGVTYTEWTWREARKNGIKLFDELFPDTYLGAIIL